MPNLPFPEHSFNEFPPFTPQQVQAIRDRLPPEHYTTDAAGNITHCTELGIIHLCTAVENICPERARVARQLRYAYQRHAAKLRATEK